MAALLSKAGKDLTVTVLLDALQQTKDFELSMAKKFGAPVGLPPGFLRVVGSKYFVSYKTSSRRHRRRQHGLCSQSVHVSSPTWGCMYNTKTSGCSLPPSKVLTF